MKVLHIVESLDKGAVEKWLVRMLSHACQRGADMDWTFYCVLCQRGEMEDVVLKLGAHIIHSPVPMRKKMAFIRALRSQLRREKYDVLHCHHDLLSAAYLLAAIGIPIGRRIVHLHNADEALPTPSRLKRNLFRAPMRFACLHMSDRVVGISNHTLDTFLNGRSRRPFRDFVHYYGVDATPFENLSGDARNLRRQLGFPEDAVIMLFAGRMVPEKNPQFVIDVLRELRRIEPRAVAVFAGNGSQEMTVADRAREQRLCEFVRLIGWRDDLPKIMSCSDCFILPHPDQPMEGFGLAVVEAQLAGLRMLLSQGIADDPLLPNAAFRRLPLSAGADVWARAALDLINTPAPSRLDMLVALKNSAMNIDRALEALMKLQS